MSQLFDLSNPIVAFLVNLLDIAIVGYVIYRILLLLKDTRAIQLIKGLLILGAVAAVSGFLELRTINWILNQIWAVMLLALAVIFQPELRRALEQIGRGQFFVKSSLKAHDGDTYSVVDKIISALLAGSKTKTGMLICLERETGLNDYTESGISIDALVTTEFLVNIFVPNTPLHDGAAIIRGNRVIAAACFLPLSDNPYISSDLGTRHRAAIGLSEVSDSIVLVVSEETGSISVAQNGTLVRSLDEKKLRAILEEGLLPKKSEQNRPWKRRG